jgi:hypothetical protein
MPEWSQDPGEGTFIDTSFDSSGNNLLWHDRRKYVMDFLHEDQDIGKWMDVYGMHIDPYDFTKEKFVDRELLSNKNSLMENLVTSKNTFDDSVRKGSFAGSYVEDTEDFYDEAYLSAKGLDLGSQQEKFGFRQDWKSDVYTMLAKLAEMEAFEPDEDTMRSEPEPPHEDDPTMPGGTSLCYDENGNFTDECPEYAPGFLCSGGTEVWDGSQCISFEEWGCASGEIWDGEKCV